MARSATMPAPSRRHLIAQRQQQAQENPSLDFASDKEAAAGLTSIVTLVGVIIGVVIAAVVGVQLLAGVAPDYFTSLETLVSVFTSGSYSTGDSTADNIMPFIGTALAFVGLLGLFGLAAGIVVIRLRGKGIV